MCRYIPDAEKPDPAKQALPGSVDNSGCSFEFRYLESRHDVSVLNHTRVHLTFKDKVRRPPPRAPPRPTAPRAPPRAAARRICPKFPAACPATLRTSRGPEHAALSMPPPCAHAHAPGTWHPAHRPPQRLKLRRRQTSLLPAPLPPSRALPPRAFLSRLQTLKLRLQQTALGERGEWLDCFEMKAC